MDDVDGSVPSTRSARVRNIYLQLKDVLQLPDRCISVSINIDVDSGPTVTAVHHLTGEQAARLVTVLSAYELVHKGSKRLSEDGRHDAAAG